MSLIVGSVGPSIITGGPANALTDDTRRKLELLGINTKNITTETEGQAILTAALAKLAAEAAQNLMSQASDPTVSIEDKIKTLATDIAVKTRNMDRTEFILRKISESLSAVQMSAGKDEPKVDKSTDFKSQLEDQEKHYQIATASENMTGATAMGYYNKMRLGLS